jgi:hypothetical protein
MEDKDLIPLRHPQEINYDNYYKFCPYEMKLEIFDGELFGSYKERKNFLLMMLFNVGLEEFVKMLPSKSKEILKEILNNED